MNKYLLVDTSSDALSLALAQAKDESEKPENIAQTTQILKNQHGVTLLPQVEKLLGQAGWQASDLDKVIVGIGPGSYTGLRIGITFAKMWAIAQGTSLASVSSLALMAAQVEPTTDWIIPIVDARRLSAYTNIFYWQEGLLESLDKDQHVDWLDWLPQLINRLDQSKVTSISFVGKDIEAFVSAFTELAPHVSVNVLTEVGQYPQVARAFQIRERHLISDIHTLAPNYAHATLAEQEWAAKNQRDLAGEAENEEYIEHFSGK